MVIISQLYMHTHEKAKRLHVRGDFLEMKKNQNPPKVDFAVGSNYLVQVAFLMSYTWVHVPTYVTPAIRRVFFLLCPLFCTLELRIDYIFCYWTSLFSLSFFYFST